MKCCVQKRLKPAKLFHSWLPHGFGLNTTPPPSPGFVGPQPRRQSYQNTHTSKPAQPTTHFFREKITIGSSDGLELRVFGFFTRNSQLHIKKKELISIDIKKNIPQLLMKPPVPTLFVVSIETKSHCVSTKTKTFPLITPNLLILFLLATAIQTDLIDTSHLQRKELVF